MTRPAQSYIICATPRSGTTLLCDLLTESGIAGQPDSFFRMESRHWWAENLNESAEKWNDANAFDHHFLSAVLREGTGQTSVFGMRLMWRDFDSLNKGLDNLYPGLANDKARLSAAFGSPRFLHLTREDKIAQAVSRFKAEQSGLWHVNADGTERERLGTESNPAYDAEVILDLVSEYEIHDAAWNNWFSEQDIDPIQIKYEDLASDPRGIGEKTMSSLGLDPVIAKSVTPKTKRMANTESHEWAARIRTEKCNRNNST